MSGLNLWVGGIVVIYIHKRHPPKSGYPQTQGGEGVGQSRLGTELAQQKACQHLGMELARQGGGIETRGYFHCPITEVISHFMSLKAPLYFTRILFLVN